MTKPACVNIVTACCILLVLCAAAPAAPTVEDLSKLPVGTALSGAASKTVGDFLDALVEQMKTAKDADGMAKTRQAILDGYGVHTSVYYQLEYARLAGEKLPALLSDNEPARQIQVAMTVASLPQITIQPALEAMAKSPNAAVRHWATRGYKSAGRLIMGQGGDYARKMLSTLENLGLNDPSAPVVADALIALNPYPDARKDQAAQMRAVQDRVLLARCRDLQAGREDMAEAFRRFVVTLAPYEGEGKAVLQMLADVLEAAKFSLLGLEGQNQAVIHQTVDLLTNLETKLLELTSTSQTPVQAALGNERASAAERAALVGLAVNKHWQRIFQDKQVKTRIAGEPSTGATRPARQPSGHGTPAVPGGDAVASPASTATVPTVNLGG